MHIFIKMMTIRSVAVLISQIIVYSLSIHLNCFHVKYYKMYALTWMSSLLYFNERRRRPVVTISDKSV